ncbi:MAG: S8 family serine peptidase [Gemmatimonadetes bacterium]|nr:S8 family serine peptidase [Gemmatimonadota bacterium]
MKRTLGLVAAAGLVVTACADPSAPSGAARLAPLLVPQGDLTTQVIPNEYLVVLRTPGDLAAQGDAVAEANARGGVVTARWDRAMNGFAARLSPTAVTELRRRPDVLYVEQDGLIHATGTQSPVGSWGQDRVDQRNLPLNNSYTYPNAGAGVHAYIIDTGINPTHTEFTGRIGNGADFTGSGTTNDGNGHGTHVAGTIGGTTYGLAKSVTLHPVRVLNSSGSGSWSWYVSAINWVIANKKLPAVANASLGGSINTSADNATDALAAAGVTFAIAAGNDNSDACTASPARRGVTNGVISTMASSNTDARASFSNYGTCGDIFAPGVSIKSAWIGSTTATSTISGTSMASPHVAGAAALYLGNNPALTPAQVEAAMKADATTGKITNPGTGSANRLLYVGNIGGGSPPPPPPTNQAPVANFVKSSCKIQSGAYWQCTFNGTSSTDDVGVVSYAWVAHVGETPKTGAIKTLWMGLAGTYNVTLTVTDAGGLKNSITKAIVVP